MKRVAQVLALSTLMVGAGGVAQAQSWGTLQSSISYSYGQYYNYGYTYARNGGQHKKISTNANKVYVRTTTDFYNGSSYKGTRSSDSAGTTSRTYTPHESNVPLWLGANVAQGKINNCEDRSFQPDPCSDAQAIPHFGY